MRAKVSADSGQKSLIFEKLRKWFVEGEVSTNGEAPVANNF